VCENLVVKISPSRVVATLIVSLVLGSSALLPSAANTTWSATQALADFTVFRPTDAVGLMPAIKTPLDASFCSPKKSAVRAVYGVNEVKVDGKAMFVILQDNAETPCWNPDVKEQKVQARPEILGERATVRGGPIDESKKNPFEQVQLSIELPGEGKYAKVKTRIHITGFNGVTQDDLIAIATSLKPV
jgi:hypothetical protein